MANIQKTLINLLPDTRYVVRVRSYNKLGVRSEWSEALEFRTGDDGSVPATPTNCDTRPGLQAIVVFWDQNTEVDFSHYELHASEIPGFIPDETNRVFDGYVNTYSHPTESGQHWFFRIRAVDVANNVSPWSDEFDDIPNFIADGDIIAQSISATKLSASTILSDLLLSGSIKTANFGPRVEIDINGIRGYALNGLDKSFWYNATDGSLSIAASITAGSTITGASFVGGSINIGSGTFTVNSSGIMTATGVNISGAINATSGSFTGAINATSGSLGSLTVTGTLTGGTLSGATVSGSTMVGGSINIGGSTFIVDASGTVQARANISVGSDYSGGLYPNDASNNPDFNWGFQFNHVTASSQYRIYMAAWLDSTDRSIGIRNSMNNDHQIYADYDGGTRSLTRTAFITVSDPAIKKDMRPIKSEGGSKDKLSKRMKRLKGFSYFVGDDSKRRIGLDANHVKAEFPEVVYEDVTHRWEGDTPIKGLGIAYEELIPYIIEILNEKDDEIEELRAMIEELR